MKPSSMVLLALALIMVAALAYSTLTPPQQPSKPTSTPPTSGKGLDFELVDVDGNVFKLSDHRGKVVVLDLMATWCPPCSALVEELKEVQAELGDDVVVVSVSVDPSHDTDDVLKSYAESKGIAWTVARDTVGLAAQFGVSAIPTIVIVDPEGRVSSIHVGFVSSEELIDLVEEAMG